MLFRSEQCGSVAVGQYALYGLTNGRRNVAIGANAGACFDNGQGTIHIGAYAGGCQYNSGDGYVVIGCNARLGNSGETGLKGIAIGGDMAIGNGCVGIGCGTCQWAYFNLSAIGWQFVSDRRKKKNITALSVDGLSFINSLCPSTFSYCVGNGKCVTGFIAQDVEKSLEDHKLDYIENVVGHSGENNDTYTLSETALLPFVVKAIQELSEKVTSLQAELDALKANG